MGRGLLQGAEILDRARQALIQRNLGFPAEHGLCLGDIRLALRKRPRVREAIIQSVLFLCGAISILTTIVIVYGLTKESLNFFTQKLWEDTNKQTVQAISAVTTTLAVPETGKALGVRDTNVSEIHLVKT